MTTPCDISHAYPTDPFDLTEREAYRFTKASNLFKSFSKINSGEIVSEVEKRLNGYHNNESDISEIDPLEVLRGLGYEEKDVDLFAYVEYLTHVTIAKRASSVIFKDHSQVEVLLNSFRYLLTNRVYESQPELIASFMQNFPSLKLGILDIFLSQTDDLKEIVYFIYNFYIGSIQLPENIISQRLSIRLLESDNLSEILDPEIWAMAMNILDQSTKDKLFEKVYNYAIQGPPYDIDAFNILIKWQSKLTKSQKANLQTLVIDNKLWTYPQICIDLRSSIVNTDDMKCNTIKFINFFEDIGPSIWARMSDEERIIHLLNSHGFSNALRIAIDMVTKSEKFSTLLIPKLINRFDDLSMDDKNFLCQWLVNNSPTLDPISRQNLAKHWRSIPEIFFPQLVQIVIEEEQRIIASYNNGPNPRLYKDQNLGSPLSKASLSKTGSDLILLGGPLLGKVIHRIVTIDAFKAWWHAYTSPVWMEKFGYIPIEPIYSASLKKRGGVVGISCGVLGISLAAYKKMFISKNNIAQLNMQANDILDELNNITVYHGHPHDGNFVVDFTGNQPKLYLIDFDRATLNNKFFKARVCRRP